MPNSTDKVLTALNDVTVLTPVAVALLTSIKKALESGNNSMTVDELLSDAEAGWDKAEADLDKLAAEGHESDAEAVANEFIPPAD